jgi:threonine/homoserine/homoserine lactone efflux protein
VAVAAEGRHAARHASLDGDDHGFGAGKSLGLGALLSGVNPKNLALTLAAAASIAQAGLSTGESTVAVLIFVVIGSITVAGPVVLFLVAPQAAAKPLDSIKQSAPDVFESSSWA